MEEYIKFLLDEVLWDKYKDKFYLKSYRQGPVDIIPLEKVKFLRYNIPLERIYHDKRLVTRLHESAIKSIKEGYKIGNEITYIETFIQKNKLTLAVS